MKHTKITNTDLTQQLMMTVMNPTYFSGGSMSKEDSEV